MADLSALELFAEISIGLVGFAGVVTALGRSRLPPQTRHFRVSALLLYSIVALGGSVLPIVLFGYGASIASGWLGAALVLLCAQVAIVVWAGRTVPRLVRDGHLPASLAVAVVSLVVLITSYLCYGIVFDRGSLASIYLTTLFVSLSLGVFHFFHLVVSVPYGDDDA